MEQLQKNTSSDKAAEMEAVKRAKQSAKEAKKLEKEKKQQTSNSKSTTMDKIEKLEKSAKVDKKTGLRKVSLLHSIKFQIVTLVVAVIVVAVLVNTNYLTSVSEKTLLANTEEMLAEIAKANISIYSEEDKVKKAQLELGKLYYRDYVVGEEMDEAEYLPWCQQIDEAKQTIADLRDYIETLKTEHVDMPVEEVDDEDFEDLTPDAAEEEPVGEIAVCEESAEQE